MKKILVCILLVVTLLLISTSLADTWDGTADTSWYDSSESKFTISTSAQLKGLSQLVYNGNTFSGKTIILESDIDLNNLSWEPIGNYYNRFSGTFDGGNHIIQNMSCKKTGSANMYSFPGLFGWTSGATIKNFTLTGVSTFNRGSTMSAGGVVAYAIGSTIDNVTSSVSVTGYWFAGGIVGRAVSNSTISNCINTGNVVSLDTAQPYYSYGYIPSAGGIVSDINTGTVSNCNNSGIITSNVYSGGIVGKAQGNVSISDSSNSGIVSSIRTAPESYLDSKATSGGIVARLISGTVSNCSNNGPINSYYVSGGLVGNMSSSTVIGNDTKCYNSGNVSIENSGYNSDLYVGGIVGYSTNSSVENAHNLTSSNLNAYFYAYGGSTSYVGGITGYSNSTTITKCDNASPNFYGQYCAGISAYSLGNSTISECNNNGKISGYNAGGIVCLLNTGKLSKCNSNGDVAANLLGYAGGVVANATSVSLDECNHGSTEAKYSVSGQFAGGIAGYSKTSQFNKCKAYNTTVEGALSGGLIGQDANSVITSSSASSEIIQKPTSYSANTETYVGGLIGKSEGSSITQCEGINSQSIIGKYAGGLAGYFSNNYDGTTAANSWTYTSINGTYAGGLFGYQIGSLNLSNFTNDKDITGLYRAGGIVGYIDGNRGTVTLTECHNKGNIISEGTTQDLLGINDGYFGGLVSRIDNVTEVTISSSSNTGNLQNASTTNRPIYAGGLIGGIIPTQDTATISFSNCNNTVDVDAKYHAGGIIGHIGKPDDTKTWMYANFIQCENSGNVTGDTYAGGISGYLSYTVDDLRQGHVGLIGYEGIYSVFQDCKNSGDVKSEIAGGIASEVCAGKMEHCLNTGDITSIVVSSTYDNIYAGGLIGVNDRGLIINSANYGNVSGGNGANGAGGLVGYNFTSIVANNYTKAPVSNAAYVGGIHGIYGKDYEQYLNGYADLTNTYSSGALSGGSVKVAGLASVWHEYFKRSYWLKSTADYGLGQYDNKVYQNPEYTKGGFFEGIDSAVQLVTFDDRFNNVDEGTNGMTILQTLEYETQNYNSSSPDISYLHWVQPQSAPSPYGDTYNGNLYPVFGYPITFVIYTDGEISSVGGSLDSTDATQIEDFFNGGYLQDYYGAYGDTIGYTAKANKGYVFERSESVDVVLNEDEASITNGFTMRALNTDEDPVVINLYFVSQYTVTISKIWDDADNADLIRPASLSMSLALNGTIIKDIDEKDVTVLLEPGEDGYWQSGVITLPNGDYENLEIWEGSSTGYSVEKRSVTINGHDISAVIVNRHDPSPKVTFTATNESMVNINYEVKKTWYDDEAVTELTHPDIVVQVFKETDTDLILVAEKTLTSGTDSVTFNDLPKYEDNDSDTVVNYTIKEFISDEHWVNIGNVWYNTDGLGAYTATVTNAAITSETEHDTTVSGGIENKYGLLQKTIDVEVTKIWNDHGNENKVRPESITLGLFRYSTDETPVKTVELKREETDTGNTAGSWTGKFEDLALYDGSEFIDYTRYVVKEWDPATSKWIFYGDSMIITNSEGLEYTYIYDKAVN